MILVLGGGLMGSATAWQLASVGEKVVLLEQQSSEYTFGSSLGEARICRSLGPKNDIWSYLHRRALTENKSLIKFLNANDQEHHAMEDIYTDSPVTYILHTDKQEAVARMLRQQPDTYECSYTPAEALEKFDVTVSENQIVIREYRKYTGTINPKALIKKLHRGILLKGGEVRFNQQVKQIQRTPDCYAVDVLDAARGSSEKIEAKRLVSAAGPYTGNLLKKVAPEFSQLITPKRVFLAFLKIRKERFQSYSADQKQKIFNFYPLIDLGPDHIFSMIEEKDKDGNPLLKVGGHFQRDDIKSLGEVWTKEVSAEEIEFGKKGVLDYFKFLNIPLQAEELTFQKGYSCVYSLTKSEVPIVSNLPQEDGGLDPNAVMLGGMSGVGAKGSLTYGLIATNLLLGKEEDDFMYQKVKKALRFLPSSFIL
ncbi:MAG: FAD-dependent oxidoreductase [Cyclobacteriaceae bacterium]